MRIAITVIEFCLGLAIVGYGVIYNDPWVSAVGGYALCDAGHRSWEILNED